MTINFTTFLDTLGLGGFIIKEVKYFVFSYNLKMTKYKYIRVGMVKVGGTSNLHPEEIENRQW